MSTSDRSTGADVLARARLILAHDEPHAFDAVVPAIVQTSLFTFSSFQEMSDTYAGKKSRNVYSRTTNPTVTLFEQKIAALEATDDAIGFPSGMAAISGAVLAFVKPGDRIVSVRHVYPDAYRLFETLLKDWGVTTDYVDGADHAAVAAVLPGAKLLYLESPTSWTMEAHDVGALAALARQHGAMSMIDNSYATPLFQQPVTLGVDLVIHSASKYIGGHSDTVAGVVAGRAELVSHIRRTICPYIGAKLAPFEAWLLLRGLRTLPARLKAHEASAVTLAQRLSDHKNVTAMHHPALAGPLPPGLTGTSGLFSFVVDDTIDIPAFCDALHLFQLGVSWGGHESLVVPALITRVQAAGPNSALDFGVSDRMIRLHVGLEGTDALWDDLTRALNKARH
ncbi:aminotransferase class I/II-fold pyridoxal phosphate-dependent enzyme [Lichenihabitans sp. PAMC28606]|uniref:aminotransferase class I/II-fold pyridoxal phosphate-dependent enzyme n=1 Tax=Lichenihabitans sp. PAMC28606 TaxID=2880932 RepID=UPI001D0A2A58|nr:aminotransferase class I/II-fold pyridoxal phosphate-dependent enzyme [Lichenihabitans sp. PAMC28606]UDL94258.1 aminotransferase class I/II-fold pyridoxal phosphate-dependent enzyme [Lichenihabitans sp. PAMC28606]